jgi:DNA-binding NtrC family response regulator
VPVRRLHAHARAPSSDPFAALLGQSAAMRAIQRTLRRVARSSAATILLRGESGTGKNLAAKALHQASPRRDGPFLNITCSSLPESLLESELFGHEPGAFTDAKQRRIGLLQLADGGTAFLDEIGDLSPALQVKLLRFLEERTFRRLGGAADVQVDARIIAATHQDLEAAVASGGLRRDLYYRISVLPVRLPPLRERQGDVALLAAHFVRLLAAELGRPIAGFSPAALARLEHHSWPGNVRELRNVVERAVLLAEGPLVEAHDVWLAPPLEEAPQFRLPEAGLDLAQLERSLVGQALARAAGNRTRAARLLNISRDQLRYRLEKFGLVESRRADAAAKLPVV